MRAVTVETSLNQIKTEVKKVEPDLIDSETQLNQISSA